MQKEALNPGGEMTWSLRRLPSTGIIDSFIFPLNTSSDFDDDEAKYFIFAFKIIFTVKADS